MNARVVALIPCYREGARIADVVQRCTPHVEEVVVIDDGSPDNTAAQARQAGATVLRHEINQGKGAAIGTGIKHALEQGFDLLMFLDGDGQHNPDEIPKFVARQRETDAAIVLGNRMTDTRRMPLVRKWTNQFTSWVLSRLAGQRIDDSQCGFRLLHRRIVPDILIETHNFETESEMLIQAGRRGHRIESVAVATIYEGQEKQSKIRPGRDAIRFIKLVWRNRKTR